MADYQLKINTQEKKVFEGAVTSLIVPGSEGYLGVLANHAPLLALLGQGKLTIRKGAETSEFQISGGFLEVHHNQATILADSLTA